MYRHPASRTSFPCSAAVSLPLPWDTYVASGEGRCEADDVPGVLWDAGALVLPGAEVPAEPQPGIAMAAAASTRRTVVARARTRARSPDGSALSRRALSPPALSPRNDMPSSWHCGQGRQGGQKGQTQPAGETGSGHSVSRGRSAVAWRYRVSQRCSRGIESTGGTGRNRPSARHDPRATCRAAARRISLAAIDRPPGGSGSGMRPETPGADRTIERGSVHAKAHHSSSPPPDSVPGSRRVRNKHRHRNANVLAASLQRHAKPGQDIHGCGPQQPGVHPEGC